MKENEDSNIEKLVLKIIKETPLESPSNDFTSQIMTTVLSIEKSKTTVYKPLISKTGWLLICGSFVAAIVYFITYGSTQNEDQFWSYGSSTKDFIKNLSDFNLTQFSGTTIMIMVLSTILIYVQITLLKIHLNNRLRK